MNAAEALENYEPVPESGCWLWLGSDDGKGYGRARIDKVEQKMHRFFYAAHVGQIPAGMFVCHKCDTPACVNPSHLFTGTNADNTRDKHAKGRHAKGAKTWGTFTDEQVKEIVTSHTTLALANKFGVCRRTIQRIRNGTYYRDEVAAVKRELAALIGEKA